MKIMHYALAASLVGSATFAGGYQAPVADVPVAVPAAPVPVGTDWTGFYTGLQYGSGDLSTLGASADFDAFGAHAGYLWDRGSYVLGVELDYNNVDVDAGGSGDLLRLRGRVGADLGRLLPYATLGMGHLSAGGQSESGITYGVGAEYLFTDSFSLGLEYSRNEFDDIAPGVDGEADLFQIRASYRF